MEAVDLKLALKRHDRGFYSQSEMQMGNLADHDADLIFRAAEKYQKLIEGFGAVVDALVDVQQQEADGSNPSIPTICTWEIRKLCHGEIKKLSYTHGVREGLPSGPAEYWFNHGIDYATANTIEVLAKLGFLKGGKPCA